MALKKSQLYSSLWSSCDALRGGMDASQYKDYVLTLLFMKYVSDKYAGMVDGLIAVPTGARALRPVPGLAVRRCAATGVFPAGAASPTGEPVGNPLHHLQQQSVASGGCEPLDGCHHADRATARRGLPVPVRSQATL